MTNPEARPTTTVVLGLDTRARITKRAARMMMDTGRPAVSVDDVVRDLLDRMDVVEAISGD